MKKGFLLACLVLTSCQLQFKQTDKDTYTLTGIKSSRSVKKEEMAKIQKKIDRATFVLDSLSEVKSRTIASHNIAAKIGDKELQRQCLASVDRINKRIEYAKKKKAEYQKQLNQLK